MTDDFPGSLSNSAARTIAIVELLSSDPNRTFTQSEIARLCAIPKSTTFTVLGILAEAGWLTRSPVDREYGLGPRLITIGKAAEETRPIVNLARPVMQRVSLSFQRTCVLSTTLGDELVVLEVIRHPMREAAVQPGHRVPWVAPYGTLFVAWQDRAARDEWYDRSAVVSSDQREFLERILNATVSRGYVVTLNSDPHTKMAEIMRAVSKERTLRDVRRTLGEHLQQLPPVAYLVDEDKAREKLTVASFQAPIFDSLGVVRYGLSAEIADLELDPKEVSRLGVQLRRAADEVTAALAAQSDHGSALNNSGEDARTL